MKTLFLLRHAKAVSEDPEGDHARPLAPRGVEACERIGRWLAERAPAPEHVLCSSAVRTRETAARVLASLDAPPPVEIDDALYLAPADTLLARLRSLDPQLDRVLLVGHNPGLQDLVVGLSDGSAREATARARAKLPTAALAELHCDVGSWPELRPRGARLAQLVIPRAPPG